MNEEDTKEIKDFEELKELEETEEGIEELDINMEESNAKFEEEVKQEEEVQEKETIEEEKKPKQKKSLKEKWQELSKKQKIIIIVSSILLLLIILGLIVYFCFFHKKEEGTSNVPDVILEEENYRYHNGELIFLDKNEKELGKYTCEHQDKETCYVAYYTLEDNFDEPKMVNEDNEKIKVRSKLVLDQYAWVYDNEEKEDGSIILYDFKNQKKVNDYQFIKGYSTLDNQYIVKQTSGEYNLIRLDETGLTNVLASSYDYLGYMDSKEENNILVSKRNNSWYLTDMSDKTLTKALSYEIKDYRNETIKGTDETGKYHIFDYNGAEKKNKTYDYIDLLEHYILYIQDQKITIEDYSGLKIWEEPIELKNTTYIPISIYDKKNKLIKTNKSYDISYQGNRMTFEIFDENGSSNKVSINTTDAIASSKLAYINYFDGKLYIYKDKEKTSLLGTYLCHNKNNTTDVQDLMNCKVARESFYEDNDIEKNQTEQLGILPIYNERYIFLADSAAPDTDPTVILYDLKENAEKATYKGVDAGAYTKSSDTVFASNNNVYVIAEKKNGEVGVIHLTANHVEGFIPFDYDHIERIGLYFLTHNSGGYQILNTSKNSVAGTYTNKPRNFDLDAGYVTTQDKSGKYYLYDTKGNPVGNKGYDYISLYEDYFGAVENKTLRFYSYENPAVSLGEEVALKQTNYYGEGILSYTASINNHIATVNVGNGNSYEKSIQIKLETNKEEDAHEGTNE